MDNVIKFPDKKLPGREKTVKDIVEAMTDEQRDVLYFLVGAAIEDERASVMSKLSESLNKGSIFTLREIRDLFKD